MLTSKAIFISLVMVAILTAVFYVYLDNKEIIIPKLKNEIYGEKDFDSKNLLKSMIISLFIVILFLIIRFA